MTAHRPVDSADEARRPTVLLADDDASFVASLEDALSGEPYDLLLARDGAEARKLYRKRDVDLVVTDIRMPKMDGVAFVSEVSRSPRVVPCIVMTAFGTPELEQSLGRMGILDFIHKPLDVSELRRRIRHGLEQSRDDSILRGLSVSSFLQLLALEHKTCTVRVKQGSDVGRLFFREGEVVDASVGELSGLDAALELVTWENAEISVKTHCPIRDRRIDFGLERLLLEAMRQKDEHRREPTAASGDESVESDSRSTQFERRTQMALEEYLQEFKEIKGYIASGIMDFTGETLVTDSSRSGVDLEATGAVFNDIFRNAHEASGKIGLEACKKMTITTPKGVIVMECSGVDAASHLHFIAVLTEDGNQALARKTLEKIVPKVVAEMS